MQAVSGDRPYLVAGEGGYGFRCLGADLLSRGKAGKAFLTLDDNEAPAIFQLATTEGELACFTRDGRALVFAAEEIRQLPKGRGLKLIAADPGKTALQEIIPVVDGVAGKLKGERLELYRGSRGGKGKPRQGSPQVAGTGHLRAPRITPRPGTARTRAASDRSPQGHPDRPGSTPPRPRLPAARPAPAS